MEANAAVLEKIPCLDLKGQHKQIKAEVFEMFESAVSRQDMDALSNLKTSVMSHWHDSEKVLADWLISQTDLELVPPLRQHETMNYMPTSPRLFPVDGP